ncbi:MAG: MBOAT family protein [Prevotella sp.]|nr:MBOAT family protein [Prevotella sp.]
MVYNSLQFIFVYPFLFLLYHLIPGRYGKARNMYLLLVSYALYVSWKPSGALVLLFVTAMTYGVARIIGHMRHPKRFFTFGIVMAILPLLVFKYLNFINETIQHCLSVAGWDIKLSGLNWAVPVGISFFTFQSIGYCFDVYKKRIPPEKDFLTYALFVSFFPSILSGPINKASLMLPQFKKKRPGLDYGKVVEGMKMLLWGMLMKTVVADRVGLYVDTVMPEYQDYNGITCFVASLLYTIQIYADFAGYSLMAIGVGKTLGFELTENFRRPYFSYSVTDFWRRWHISLSTWLKDYVYIPLGGSRCSKARNYFNIIVTFLVSGIWHGANWTFVVWGLFHGLIQVVEKMLGQQKCNYGAVGKTVKVVITFLLVNFAWIFFRMPTIEDACGLIARIFTANSSLSVFYDDPQTLMLTVASVILLLLKDVRDEFYSDKMPLMNSRHLVVRWATYVILAIVILLMGVFGTDQFIYANF